MKVTFYQGLPASGKSTEAKRFCHKNPDWVRVNRDDLRNMRGRYWIPKQEKLITNWEADMILSALSFDKNVIVDSTNLNQKHLKSLKEKILRHLPEVEFSTKFFEIDPKEAIKRDLGRANSVGADVIMGMYNKYLAPTPEDKTIKQNDSLPHVIICDLDGTVAKMNGRSPYDWDKCDTDLPNKPVISVVENYICRSNTKVIFLSGRDGRGRQKTYDWLKKYIKLDNKEFDLFMRIPADTRKDSIIKQELFDEHIKDKYYVDFVLDDRNQVVELWRSLGLTCLQVADGDF